VLDQNAQKHYGKLPARISQIMETLSSSSSVQFEIVNQLDSSFAERSDADAGCQANIIVYGALEEALDIGDWLSQCDIYLQQPLGASQDVPYRNPQSLDFDDDKIVLTSELVPVPAGQDQEQEFVADIWSGLEDFQKLDEADQPPLIRTILHRHQKQALTFLQRRERGWDFVTSAPDIWKSYTDRPGRQRYRNVICGESQAEPPPLFQGGCLADPMGLGKTLSVLSLIALCPARTLTEGASTVHTTPRIKATLIVVPASLVQVWET
jgi:SWI/SNF-related matrix-associated actin-dependent regulator of chromatin subfamily A3